MGLQADNIPELQQDVVEHAFHYLRTHYHKEWVGATPLDTQDRRAALYVRWEGRQDSWENSGNGPTSGK